MPQHEISNNVVDATSKGSDQPAHMRNLIRAFASRRSSRLNILWLLGHCRTWFGVSKLKRRLHRLVWVYTCQNITLLEITNFGITCTYWYFVGVLHYIVSFIDAGQLSNGVLQVKQFSWYPTGSGSVYIRTRKTGKWGIKSTIRSF